jgi:hypothetical protein
MKDYLLDLVSHTYDLGCIDLIKITGDSKSTAINGLADDRSVVVQAQFLSPIAEFNGTFGMPDLSNLKRLLSVPEYLKDAKITVKRQDRGEDKNTPVGLHFQNKNADFNNDYRFMVSEIVNNKLKAVKFKGANWDVEFQPEEMSIQRLKYQADVNPNETTFKAKTEKSNLVFTFGDHSTHAGSFVFQSNIEGTLKGAWHWPIKHVISILNLTGNKTMRISDNGAAEITVESGIAIYTYILPAQSK